MVTLNEGKVCDAVVRHLEVVANVSRTDVRTRDRHSDPGKRVELTFRLGAELVAVEHTGIEPFDGFMRLNAESERHFEPIKAAASHAVPSGSLVELHVPVNAFRGRPPREVSEIQTALTKFIINTAPKLPERRYKDHRYGDPIIIPGVPFTVRLYRFESMGILPPIVVYHVAKDVETTRAERLREACEKKFPKLARWKIEDNARTILVLEDNDIQLTSPANVADAFVPIARSRADAPDETYMIFTAAEPWYMWPMLIRGASYFDLAKRGDSLHSEIDASSLNTITQR